MEAAACKNALSSIKRQITRINNWFNTNRDTEDIYTFELKMDQLQSNYEKYVNMLDDITVLDDENLLAECDAMDNKYCETIVGLKRKIDELRVASATTVSNPLQQVSSMAKLPEITINSFSGDFSEWSSFFELFENLIIKDPGLTDIQKFVYLKSYLKGEPLGLVNSLQLSNSNFQIAINTLKERYQNQSRIVNSHLRQLIEVPVLSKTSPSDMRKFIVQAKQSIEAIKNLNIPKQDWSDLILIYIYSQKLDFNTNRAFESERESKKLPTLTEFFYFLDKRCSVIETVSEGLSRSNNTRNARTDTKTSHHIQFKQNENYGQARSQAHSSGTARFKCPCCSSSHLLFQCVTFKKKSPQQRHTLVSEKRLCKNCLALSHTTTQCNSAKNCMICNRRHHTLLHLDNFIPSSNPNQNNTMLTSSTSHHPSSLTSNNVSINPDNSSSTFQTSTSTCSAVSSNEKQVLLATALVKVLSKHGGFITVRALLDNGSQTSFITENLAQKIQGKFVKNPVQIMGISTQVTQSQKSIELEFHSALNTEVKFATSCVILNRLTCNLPIVTLNVNQLQIPEYIRVELADPMFFESQPVDLLLGMDVYGELLNGDFKRLGKNQPVLINTYLGWTVSGGIHVRSKPSRLTTNCCNLLTHVTIDQGGIESNNDLKGNELLQKFWTLEELPESGSLSADDELAEQLFKDTTLRLEDGRFQVQLPLKSSSESSKIGDSYQQAKRRFFSLENKFNKNPKILEQYKQFIHEYINLGHAKEVHFSLQNESSQLKYFLPHHCVVREESLTTKLRVVFDASMRTSSGYSLNDILLKGPQVQSELFDILCRFRTFKFVLVTDIEKMYRQVRINPVHTYLQNILWRDSPTENLRCLELQTVTYGTSSAPFLATRCLQELAKTNQQSYPLAADAIIHQCYVDDIISGCNSLSDLTKLHYELTSLMGSAGMSLHKWSSNSPQFLNTISAQTNQPNYIIHSLSEGSKVLGMGWNPNEDIFQISVPKIDLAKIETKRQVLASIAQIFDPMGFINPYIVLAKLLMQEIWISKISWDEKLNSELLKKWTKFITGISSFSTLKVPRSLFTLAEDEISTIEIHSFSDASLKCYGACVYVRVIYHNSTSCHLVASKSRVAPIKLQTLPRLELCGALVMSKLTNHIVDTFKNKINICAVHLWTDSEIVLAWLNSHPNRWSIFVGNRVSQVQSLTQDYKWHHIKSKDNPADILSRGCMPNDLTTLWWHGPAFLQESHSNFQDKSIVNISNVPEERKNVFLSQKIKDNEEFLTSLNRFSNFRRLQGAVAYCFRFAFNSKNPSNKRKGPLSVDELINAERQIVKLIQHVAFPDEIKQLSKNNVTKTSRFLKPLSPFLDDFAMVRVGGRLSRANITYDHKHPLLLPSKSHLVRLLIKREHLRLYHAGPQNTLANFRLRYWPVDGTREVKSVIYKCLKCFRFQVKPLTQFMSDLPKERVSISKPFTYVGIDFAGPFQLKPSKLRSRTILKGYMAVFVCFSTKAVHLEAVSSLSTEDFLQTLRRFIARRGIPSIIYSDNGTNFQGACNKLREIYTFLKSPENKVKISDYLNSNQISWKFIPARSPHWGGIWEAGVKIAKYHLIRVIGDSTLTYEQLATVLAEVEAIMNSRPLCKLSNDPSDLSPLTPGHFLIGCPLTSIIENDISSIPDNRLSSWSKCVQIKQHFWKRWMLEYLHTLQTRSKWTTKEANLRVNDMVLLMDNSFPPLHWPIARVVDVITGSDGMVRAALVKTKNGQFTRAISKLCPLPAP